MEGYLPLVKQYKRINWKNSPSLSWPDQKIVNKSFIIIKIKTSNFYHLLFLNDDEIFQFVLLFCFTSHVISWLFYLWCDLIFEIFKTFFCVESENFTKSSKVSLDYQVCKTKYEKIKYVFSSMICLKCRLEHTWFQVCKIKYAFF